jgi:hypothetical protein
MRRSSVGEGVVGKDTFDPGDPVLGEESCRAFEHTCSGGAFLVGLYLGVGEAGVVVDDGVDVVESDATVACAVVAVALGGVGAPAATVGDAAQFLHVNVHQLARPIAFIPIRGGARGANDRGSAEAYPSVLPRVRPAHGPGAGADRLPRSVRAGRSYGTPALSGSTPAPGRAGSGI